MKRFTQPRHLSDRQGGFSLIELMIVVAIIAILAGIAIPQYQNYVAKAQTAAALAEITPGKIGVETLLAEGTSTTLPVAIGLRPVTPRCSSITVAMPGMGEATLTCAINGGSKVAGNVVLARDDNGVWTCTSTVTDKNLLPSSCRGGTTS